MRSIVAVSLLGVLIVACSAAQDDGSETSTEALSPVCDMVKCAMPLCAQGQHLAYQGSCCPTCAGPTSRCAAIMCKMEACPEGQALVTSNGDCCGRCAPVKAVPACNVDLDCPQIACIRCPCPVSECRGKRCVTTTPDESTCGGAL